MGHSRQFLPERGDFGEQSSKMSRSGCNQKVLAGLPVRVPKPGTPPGRVSLLT